MVRYLAKVVLTLEPTLMKDKFHEDVREITAHHKSNLLQMMGVDPVVYRTSTSKGEIDLQIWITTIPLNPLNRIIMPFYYIGAKKYIFMCETDNCVDFVRTIIDLAERKLNALYEFVILVPEFFDIKSYSRIKAEYQKLFAEKNLNNYSFYKWKNPNDLEVIFSRMAEDVITETPEDAAFVPIGFNLDVVKNYVRKQGSYITEKDEIYAQIASRKNVRFIVNLKKNIVYAEMSDCENFYHYPNCPHDCPALPNNKDISKEKECPNICTIAKKLCIVVADDGFSTIPGLGDLRMLSILIAINDGTLLELKGNKPQEDILAQLEELENAFKKKCKETDEKKS